MTNGTPEQQRPLSRERQEALHHDQAAREALPQGEVREFIEELGEGAEILRETVSETGERTGEDKGVALRKAQVVQKTKGQIGDIRRHLGTLPTERTMVRQIRQTLHREIAGLLSEAHRERFSRQFNPLKLNGILARVRELKERLASLASLTYEILKNLWLKVVKGVV